MAGERPVRLQSLWYTFPWYQWLQGVHAASSQSYMRQCKLYSDYIVERLSH
jgi:hypothetical protein